MAACANPAVLDCKLNALFDKATVQIPTVDGEAVEVDLAVYTEVREILRSVLEAEGPCTVRDLGRSYEKRSGRAVKAAAGVAMHAFLEAHPDFAVARAQEGKNLPFKDVVSLRAAEAKLEPRSRATQSSAATPSSCAEPEPEEGLTMPIPRRKSKIMKNTFVELPIDTDLYDADLPQAPRTCPAKRRLSLMLQVQLVAPSDETPTAGSPRSPGCSPVAFPEEYDFPDCQQPGAFVPVQMSAPVDPMVQMQMLLQAQTQTILALQSQVHALQQQMRQIVEAKE